MSGGVVSSLHCLPSFDNVLGGSIHAGLNVCKYLARAGQPVEAVAPYAAGDDVGYLDVTYRDFTCHRILRSFPRRFANASGLGPWLRANLERFELVEIHGIWVMATWQAARVCVELGKPYFIRPHGSLDPFDLQKRAWAKRRLGPYFVRWLLDHSAGVICTAALESERIERYGARPVCHAMPLPVPLVEMAGDRAAFRRHHKIPADAQAVLFLSRVDYKKGLNFLIPALARLKREFPRLWFIMAGTGSPGFREQVRGWLEAEGVAAFTSQVGFVSGKNKVDAFAAADAFALPSLNENFGLVLIEAMQAGLPLLISEEVYIHPEIERAGAGLVCRTDVASVKENLRAILADPTRARAMGQSGHALVQRRYRPEAATAELLELYARTLAST